VFSCVLMAYLAAILIRNQTLWLAILICMLGFYSVRLYQTNRSWSDAARISRSIADELVDSSTRDHLLILNAPDNLRGVPVFHNGLPEALLYFQKRKRFRQVEIIAFQDLQSAVDEVAVTPGPGYLSLRQSNDKGFGRVQSSECIETTAHLENALEFRLKPCAADADLFFFSKGKMTLSPGR
jgi:hypothetical protein